MFRKGEMKSSYFKKGGYEPHHKTMGAKRSHNGTSIFSQIVESQEKPKGNGLEKASK
jgi:hypothetical protein